MSYLSRESASLPDGLWEQIDATVINTARNVLTCRRFLHIYGPLGIGTESINIDDASLLEEHFDNGFITTKGRKFVEIPTIYEDFTILARDLENSEKLGYPVDMSTAAQAAEACSKNEDHFIFFGNKAYGYEGLLTASRVHKIERSDWSTGENAFLDIVSALEYFTQNGIFGPYALAISPDLFTQLHRIQPGTGLIEYERISKMLNGNVFTSAALGVGKAVIVCSDARNIDIVIGQDMATAYLEQTNLNHTFRILESILLRIKRKEAIVIFE